MMSDETMDVTPADVDRIGDVLVEPGLEFVRLLAPAPDNWDGLTYPGAVSVNEVDVDGTPHVAVYFEGEGSITEEEWREYVSGWKPPSIMSGPTLDDVAAAIAASPDLAPAVKDALVGVLEAVRSS